MSLLSEKIEKMLKEVGVKGEIELTMPPNPDMGDLAFACFSLAKEWKKSPAECAREIKKELDSRRSLPRTAMRGGNDIVERVEAVGPYINFYLNARELARLVLKNQKSKIKNQKSKIMIEFAHPNTHKPVHIGHLRNMITGESLVRLLESQGYKVIRANYQGDVGMHIAKCLWGILQTQNSKLKIQNLQKVGERAKFLGKVYAVGGKAYEKDEKAKKEIEEINTKIYSGEDKEINKLYKTTRKWSLEYFDYVYKRVGVKKFDRLYFESETPERAVEIVRAGLRSGVFKESRGAVIFEGSKYGLHDRVFLNSRGLPVYEAKDQALAEIQFKEYKPDEILHLVAKEQTEYFKVIFKALEFTLPESKGREKHLVYGWVSLKEGKMSSRTGHVVLAEWLLDEVEKRITEIMRDREIRDKEMVIRKIANAAVKYSMLKTGIENDIVFDLDESISLTGDSGPYLLYIVARINSILRKSKVAIGVIPAKAGIQKWKKLAMDSRFRGNDNNVRIEPEEKRLLLELAKFAEVIKEAAEEKDPSLIAKYLFNLAQTFNNFYQACPVLQAEEELKNFRLRLIMKVREAMTCGLDSLGIDAVEEM